MPRTLNLYRSPTNEHDLTNVAPEYALLCQTISVNENSIVVMVWFGDNDDWVEEFRKKNHVWKESPVLFTIQSSDLILNLVAKEYRATSIYQIGRLAQIIFEKDMSCIKGNKTVVNHQNCEITVTAIEDGKFVATVRNSTWKASVVFHNQISSYVFTEIRHAVETTKKLIDLMIKGHQMVDWRLVLQSITENPEE